MPHVASLDLPSSISWRLLTNHDKPSNPFFWGGNPFLFLLALLCAPSKYVTRSRNNPTWDAISPSLIQPIVVGWLTIERREASTASRTMSGVGALVWATRRNKVLVSRPHRPPILVANTRSLHRLERRSSGHVRSLDLRAS